MNKLELDLAILEAEASRYLSDISSGVPAALKPPSMSGILPILEAVSTNQVHELFTQALNNRCLCVASLCCNPPDVGLNLINHDPAALIERYDANAPGKALRAICIAIAKKEFPLLVGEHLSKVLCAKGLPVLNTLVKNGLYELGMGVGMAPFKEGKTSLDRLFLSNLHKYAGAQPEESFTNLLGESQYFAFIGFIEEGASLNTVEFLEYATGLAGGVPSLKKAVVDNYITAFNKVFAKKPRATDLASVITLLLSTNHPSVDDYRLAVIKSIDTKYELTDFLKASFKLYSRHYNEYQDVPSVIAAVYIDVDPEVLTAGIRDQEDYKSLSALPGFDMYRIDVTKIPKQARGAALEHGLGL